MIEAERRIKTEFLEGCGWRYLEGDVMLSAPPQSERLGWRSGRSLYSSGWRTLGVSVRVAVRHKHDRCLSGILEQVVGRKLKVGPFGPSGSVRRRSMDPS